VRGQAARWGRPPARPPWHNGWYDQQPDVGLRAFARVYSGWGLSAQFYWDEQWRQLGYATLDDFLVGYWEGHFLGRDANNLLAMLWTWKHGDVGKTAGFDGDTKKALDAIKARLIQMPAHEDRYFAPEEDKRAGEFIKGSEFRGSGATSPVSARTLPTPSSSTTRSRKSWATSTTVAFMVGVLGFCSGIGGRGVGDVVAMLTGAGRGQGGGAGSRSGG